MTNNLKVAKVHRLFSVLYGTLIALLMVFSLTTERSDSHHDLIDLEIFFCSFLGALFLLHLLIAIGAKKGSPLARRASIGVAIIMFFGFPIGTAISIYLLANSKEWPLPQEFKSEA